MKYKVKAAASLTALALILLPGTAALCGERGEGKIRLRVCNWEEYIDLGDWDEEETIDLESGDIIGVNPMIRDFEEWYKETYGREVEVEYSTFGNNEDLYNMLTLGDVYDLVCPSEYMIMKLMNEGMLEPLSEDFFDTGNENNYYINGVSPYIRRIFDEQETGGEAWSKYMAGYMWGITGIVYDPAQITQEEASTWKLLADPAYKRRVTIKDNVRDSYFAAVGAIKSDLLTDNAFTSAPDYAKRLEEEMNDISPETLGQVQEWLKDVKDNAYSFESDAGKADLITGKVAANYQWSGDGVYTLDQADEEDYRLQFTVPQEATNIYFDGWVMLKDGIKNDPDRQQAAEAFINFISRPDNVIRNMYYIGYTSCIAGGSDDRIFEYAQWNYDVDEEDADGGELIDYDLGYFFGDGEDYTITARAGDANRQLGAAYPSQEDMARSSIMTYYDEEQNAVINQMWINVRCISVFDMPAFVWGILFLAAVGLIFLLVRKKKRA